MVAVLTIWEGDYGVASVDISSLILVTYVKFAKIQCTIKHGRNPLFYVMPRLYVEEENSSREIVGFPAIWEYFRGNIFDTDHFMSQEQKSELHAYFLYIKMSLLPGIHFTGWIDEQNYTEVTRKWFRSALYFPVNFWYPYYAHKIIFDYVKALVPNNDIKQNSQVLIDEAKNCIRDLSTKLGNKNYFFGNNPSSLDAVVYGHLAPLLNVPFPASQLQICLKEHDNLVKFVRRITTIYFPQQKLEYKYVDRPQHDEDLQDFRASTRTVALAAFCAASAMITYGIVNGIIKLPSGYS